MLRQLEIPSRLSHAQALTYANEMGFYLNNAMHLQSLTDTTVVDSHSLCTGLVFVSKWSLSIVKFVIVVQKGTFYIDGVLVMNQELKLFIIQCAQNKKAA